MTGSTKIRTSLKDADLDLVVQTSEVEFSRQQQIVGLEEIYDILRQVMKENGERRFCNILFSKGTTPVITTYDSLRRLNIDIVYNLQTSLRTSKLIAYYVNVDDRLEKLVIFLKHFCAEKHIGSFNKALSSISITLMAIMFLQEVNPPVLPIVMPMEVLNDEFNPQDYTSRNNMTVSALLYRFFRYFSGRFQYIENVVTIAPGRPLLKIEAMRRAIPHNREYYWKILSIAEPFTHLHQMYFGFQEAANAMRNAETIHDIL